MAKVGIQSVLDLKSYHDVHMTIALAGGGYSSIQRELQRRDRPAPAASWSGRHHHRARDRQGDPAYAFQGPALVFLFKQRDPLDKDPRKAIEGELKQRGRGELLRRNCEDGTAWLNFAIHDNETSSNEWRKCALVAMYGVHHDSDGPRSSGCCDG